MSLNKCLWKGRTGGTLCCTYPCWCGRSAWPVGPRPRRSWPPSALRRGWRAPARWGAARSRCRAPAPCASRPPRSRRPPAVHGGETVSTAWSETGIATPWSWTRAPLSLAKTPVLYLSVVCLQLCTRERQSAQCARGQGLLTPCIASQSTSAPHWTPHVLLHLPMVCLQLCTKEKPSAQHAWNQGLLTSTTNQQLCTHFHSTPWIKLFSLSMPIHTVGFDCLFFFSFSLVPKTKRAQMIFKPSAVCYWRAGPNTPMGRRLSLY